MTALDIFFTISSIVFTGLTVYGAITLKRSLLLYGICLYSILPILGESKSFLENGELVHLTIIMAFKALDVAWAARDYPTMKSMIEDGGLFVFEDGFTATTGQEFVDKVEVEYQESLEKEEAWGWRTDYAFSVYPKGSNDPKATNQKGQWVNAQFTGNDGTYIEWYQIVDGKLKMWYQTKGDYVIPLD
jgi:hypothetical protein